MELGAWAQDPAIMASVRMAAAFILLWIFWQWLNGESWF